MNTAPWLLWTFLAGCGLVGVVPSQDGDGDGGVGADSGPWVDDDSGTDGSVDEDHDGWPANEDCDDHDPTRYPGAVDTWCDGIDHDCDGVVETKHRYHYDSDGDSYGSDDLVHDICGPPRDSWVTLGGDCDDYNPAIHPFAAEVCDGFDDNCDHVQVNGVLEEDHDRDGYLNCEDCNDLSPDIHPGAVEVCDPWATDEDCDGVTDDDDPDVDPSSKTIWYRDADGDGYGTTAYHMTCHAIGFYHSGSSDDCDDGDWWVRPTSVDICGNGIDDDCDGDVDEEDCTVCDLLVPLDEPTVQDGITAATAGDVVCVGAGTYLENIDFGGTAVTVRGIHGRSAVILDGSAAGSTVTFRGEGASASELRDLTVRNGYATNDGGGILIDCASPTLYDLDVGDNSSAMDGGGIAIVAGAPTLSHVRVHGNDAGGSGAGGGLMLRGSDALLEDVLVEGNKAHDGGGLAIVGGAPTIERVRIRGNSAEGGDGGGLYIDGSTAVVTGAQVDHNGAWSRYGTCPWCDGGGLYVTGGGAPSFTGVLFQVDPSEAGTDVEVDDGDPSFVDVVIADARATTGFDVRGGAPSIAYVDVWMPYGTAFGGITDPTGTDGNVEVAPLLVGDAGHLDASSPLVDAGDPSILDPDGSVSDIGVWSGPDAASWDLDGDGYPSWWLPGPYDALTSPGADCDDSDATVYPGHGC